MQIIEYDKKYQDDVMMLFEELQEYIAHLDPYKHNVMNKDYGKIYLDNAIKEVAENKGKFYLALDGKIIGLVCGIIYEPEIENGYKRKKPMGEVTELIVTKKARSNGAGKALLTKIENYFQETGCEIINIDVFGYNDLARNFYEKRGYHERLVTVSKKI